MHFNLFLVSIVTLYERKFGTLWIIEKQQLRENFLYAHERITWMSKIIFKRVYKTKFELPYKIFLCSNKIVKWVFKFRKCPTISRFRVSLSHVFLANFFPKIKYEKKVTWWKVIKKKTRICRVYRSKIVNLQILVFKLARSINLYLKSHI